MDAIKIQVTATNAVRTSRPENLTSGLVGLPAEFTFSADWDGLTKTAVCEGSGTSRDVLNVQDKITVPHECLTEPGTVLRIGVYGSNADGTVVIPTVYATIGRLDRGADPSGDESADPTLPIWAQMQRDIGDLDDLQTAAKSNLVSAINEAAKTGGSGQQVQADWDQNDAEAADYIKNRTHYSTFELLKTGGHRGDDPYIIIRSSDISWPELACIEINGTKFDCLKDYSGDGNSDLWADGGGMGFYIVFVSDYRVYIDENRFGPTADAVVKLYKQTIEKKLNAEYLPLAEGNTAGAVRVWIEDNLGDYLPCVRDENGGLYSKSFSPAKIYSELSMGNLESLVDGGTVGDHGLFTDSISDDFSGYGFMLPIHAWYIKNEYSSSPYKRVFLLEDAAGTVCKMAIAIGIAKIASTDIILQSPAIGIEGALTIDFVDEQYTEDYDGPTITAFLALANSGSAVAVIDGTSYELTGSFDKGVYRLDYNGSMVFWNSIRGTTGNVIQMYLQPLGLSATTKTVTLGKSIQKIPEMYLPETAGVEPLIVNITPTSEPSGDATQIDIQADHTPQEIMAALQSGRQVFANFMQMALPLRFAATDGAVFSGLVDSVEVCFFISDDKTGIGGLLFDYANPLKISGASAGQYVRIGSVGGGAPTSFTATDDIVIKSSTQGSSKQFKITVDDSGTLSATEVTTS